MSRFSKHLLLFLLINIASGTYFPSFSLSHLIKRYYLHHRIAVIKFFFCCGARSHRTVFAPQSLQYADVPDLTVQVLERGCWQFSFQTGNAEEEFWNFLPSPGRFLKGLSEPWQWFGSGRFWVLSSAPTRTRYTPRPAEYQNYFNVKLSACSTDMGK